MELIFAGTDTHVALIVRHRILWAGECAAWVSSRAGLDPWAIAMPKVSVSIQPQPFPACHPGPEPHQPPGGKHVLGR